MPTMLHQPEAAITPASGNLDISAATQLPWKGPFWLSFSAWVATADAAAGFLGFALFYTDPTGVERQLQWDNAVLILSDATSIFTAPVLSMVRLDGASSWRLESSLLFSAGAAKISYELSLLPVDETDLQLLAF